METNEYNNRTAEERKWNYREVARQLVEIQKAMSTSLLTLVKTLEEDVEDGITPERVPAIRNKYATLSRRVQQLSTLSEPPIISNLSRTSSNAALCWASDYFTNLKNVIDNDDERANIYSSSSTDMAIRPTSAGQNTNHYLTCLESKNKREEECKGFKWWLKKKFRNISEDTSSTSFGDKKQESFPKTGNVRPNAFTEKYNILSNSGDGCTHFEDGNSLTKLCVFDSNRMPLTDLHGNVLKNAFGQPILLFDNRGIPLDRTGAPVYDSRGTSSTAQGFAPTENYRATKLSPIALFDSKGYPLTGKNGHTLLDPAGEYLVKYCRPGTDGLVLSDKNGGGVWDANGIPVCPIVGRWLDQEGRPYRLFMSNGMPVTDSLGRELFNVEGESLLMKDSYGRPHEVHDTFGVPISAYAFDGTLHPPSEVETFCCLKGNPMRLYNSRGHSLTDENGRVLFDSFGNHLVRVDFHKNPLKDEEGTDIFDEKKFPLFCNPTQPIKNMDGKTMLFYDKNRRPLTDRRGVPLVHASGILLLKFDEVGRPYADQKGKPLCDINGNEISDAAFDATNCITVSPAQLQITYSGKPGFVVYDKSGRPLTDSDGNALVNSDGTSLEFNVIKQKRKVLKQEFDHFGRPLFDKFNRNLYCHGKPIFDLFGQQIIDIELEQQNSDRFRSGEFNRFGIPIKDKYLRDLYDDRGAPLCDNTGTPESKEVHDCEGILLTVKDDHKIIKQPIYRAKMLQGLGVELEGLLVGIPKEFSIIPDEWVISSVQSDDEPLPKEEEFQYLSAVIRTSHLSSLTLLHEILAIIPVKA